MRLWSLSHHQRLMWAQLKLPTSPNAPKEQNSEQNGSEWGRNTVSMKPSKRSHIMYQVWTFSMMLVGCFWIFSIVWLILHHWNCQYFSDLCWLISAQDGAGSPSIGIRHYFMMVQSALQFYFSSISSHLYWWRYHLWPCVPQAASMLVNSFKKSILLHYMSTSRRQNWDTVHIALLWNMQLASQQVAQNPLDTDPEDFATNIRWFQKLNSVTISKT